MPSPLAVSSHHKTLVVKDAEGLRQLLLAPDSYGGGAFWLGPINGGHPHMAIRVSGGNSDIHYFPSEGHPGFRRLAPNQGDVRDMSHDLTFRFEGCDPDEGEPVPVTFVLPLDVAVEIATGFMETGSIEEPRLWFEL